MASTAYILSVLAWCLRNCKTDMFPSNVCIAIICSNFHCLFCESVQLQLHDFNCRELEGKLDRMLNC